MSHLTLEFPLLITPVEKEGYQLRPLLFPGPVVTHKRYAKAVEALRKAIRQELKHFETDRSNASWLLWRMFSPNIRFQIKKFDIRWQKKQLSAAITSVFFRVKNTHYVCFPKLEYLTIMLASDIDAVEQDQHLFFAIQAFFRAQQNNRDPDRGNLSRYLSPPNESTGQIQIGANIAAARFPFEHADPGFFAFFDQQEEMNGGRELSRVGRDLNDDYPDHLADAYLRESLAGEIKDIVYQPQHACLAIIGPRGCGKTTLIQAAVKRFLSACERPHSPKNPALWYLDPLRVIAGMSVIGMWQRRMEAIIRQLRFRLREQYGLRKTDHLYIDNPVALFRIGKSAQNGLTLADVLKPYLEKHAFSMVIEATPQEWRKTQQLDRKFSDLFEVIRVSEPHPDDAIKMLTWQRMELEKEHHCCFDAEAISSLWNLQQQVQSDDVLPGSVIRTLHQLATRWRGNTIGKKAVYDNFHDTFKFRNVIFDHSLPLIEQELKTHIDGKLIGQQRAKQSLINTIHIIKARLGEADKPLASLLFIGPTGVGKTEAAKTLADYLFSDAQCLLRFDMNEYIDAGAVARLIGDWRQPEGRLTAAVRQKKACLLLLDEIEKAHPQVHDLLLQVLGEGRLSDALGRTTSFSQCIIIMTSNLGAGEAMRTFGFVANENDNNDNRRQTYRQAVEQFFRPEFLNRIDEQVVFEALSLSEAVALTRIQIRRLLKRDGFTRRATYFNVSRATLEHVARSGYDSQLGGRALKRNIERSLTTLSAEELVKVAPAQPLLLEIYLCQGVLKPHLQALQFATRQDIQLPLISDGQMPAAFLALFEKLNKEEIKINHCIDQSVDAERYDLWQVKENLLELKHTVANVCWDIQQWQNRSSGKPFQLKQRGSGFCSDWRRPRVALKNLGAQQEIVDYFHDLYNSAERLSEITNDYYLEHYLSFLALRSKTQAYLQKTSERLGICIVPCVETESGAEISYLRKHYESRLSAFDASDIRTEQRGVHSILIGSGYGIYDHFKRESGVHLCKSRHASDLPFRIAVKRLDEADEAYMQQACIMDRPPPERPHPGNIIRIYIWSDKHPAPPLVSDLRTGLISDQGLHHADRLCLLDMPAGY